MHREPEPLEATPNDAYIYNECLSMHGCFLFCEIHGRSCSVGETIKSLLCLHLEAQEKNDPANWEPNLVPGASTSRNTYLYDENLNDKSKTVIEDRFLRRIFSFHHRSVMTILQHSLSMTKSDIVTKNVIEQHKVCHKKTSRDCFCSFVMILFRTVMTRASSLN